MAILSELARQPRGRWKIRDIQGTVSWLEPSSTTRLVADLRNAELLLYDSARDSYRLSHEARVVAARAARPWLGIPISSVDEFEVVSCDAHGVLVVENLETFEEVARRSDVPEEWVCVYGAGYVDGATLTLLDRLALPVAAWADLDPHGVAIADRQLIVEQEAIHAAVIPDLLATLADL